MKIAALVGSLREDSYNLGLARTIAQRHKDLFHLHMLELGTLPFYNEDYENHPPEQVVQLKQDIAQAEGVLIATPEFNWSIPGVLKNALEWLSRGEKVLIDKPVLIVGASTGMVGTLRAQTHLRQILASPGLSARVLPAASNEVLVHFANQKFDDSGQLVDAATLQFLDEIVRKFMKFISESEK